MVDYLFSCISAPLKCHSEASLIQRWIFSPPLQSGLALRFALMEVTQCLL